MPVGLAALVVGWRKLPHVPGHDVPRPDAVGAALVTAGVAALTFGLVKVNKWDWDSTGVLASLAVAVILLVIFAVHCARAGNPLIEPALFRMRAFTRATLAMVPFATAFGAMLLALVASSRSKLLPLGEHFCEKLRPKNGAIGARTSRLQE